LSAAGPPAGTLPEVNAAACEDTARTDLGEYMNAKVSAAFARGIPSERSCAPGKAFLLWYSLRRCPAMPGAPATS
jgi:hypothetical protein